MDKPLPDFNTLVKLAKENPQALESLRQELCENVIQSAPADYQRKLRGLQFKIDMERRKAKTPMAACLKLSQMMQDSFLKLRAALNELQGGQPQTYSQAPAEQPGSKSVAEIIEFPLK